MANEYLFNILGITLILAILALVITLWTKMEKIKELQLITDNLKRSLNEMDEQAKLIVRTDMELNKTQEELDKKITGLYTLQRLSRALNTTLEENSIFKMVDGSTLQDLGFERAAAFLWNHNSREFVLRLSLGYQNEQSAVITQTVNKDKDWYNAVIQRLRTVSSLSLDQDKALKEKITRLFLADPFIIVPILPKEGDKGFFIVGTQSPEVTITEGDEELIAILTNQLGQALENARLFEDTWRAQQDLENKVEERTQALSLALDEVGRISKRKTDFISAVSHELRTPLTSIKGYASILLTGKLGDIPPEARLRLEKINRHSDELTHLVNDLLDISRIQSGKVAMKQEPVNLHTAVAAVFDLLAVQLKERQIDTGLEIGQDAAFVYADANQLSRVFINLIGNALKFTPEKGKISVRTHLAGDMIRIDVCDTGCGISEDAKEAVFEEFYRVDNAINQQVKGTGLGLSLVKNIVEAHGGKIWAESKPGNGATFSFTLAKPG